MQLSFNGSTIVGRQLHLDLTDKATGEPYPVRMKQDGAYLHKHRGNRTFMTALENFEKTTLVDGKPIREVWLSLLADHLANAAK